MKARSKKFLSLLLATAMVFTLNTTVFAEEVAVDSVDDAVEATVDAVDEVAEEATVDNTDDTVAATEDVQESQGFKYTMKDGKVTLKTTVKYDSNGEKKNAKNNVATITDTTDPVSWNGAYGTDLMAAVLFGGEGSDEYLNNSKPVSVSLDSPVGPAEVSVKEIPSYDDDLKFKVIPVTDGSTYLFVAYGVRTQYGTNANEYYYASDLVAGHDDAVATAFGKTSPESIPVTVWDGRTVEYNKSGDAKFDTGKKEAIDVTMSLVTYSNGTVTEVNGVEVGGVKVDKKNQKAASVEADTQAVSKTYKDNVTENGKTELKDVSKYVLEHKTLTDLPYFTISAKVGKDAKSYKKDVATKLKDNKFFFGIMQANVNVLGSEIGALADGNGSNEYSKIIKTKFANDETVEYWDEEDEEWKTGTRKVVSADGIKKVSGDDITDVEKAVAENLTNGAWADAEVDVDKVDLGVFEFSKFNEKKMNVVVKGYVGDKKKGYSFKNLKALKSGDKGDYSLGTTSLAGTTVYTLDFKDGGNYVYAPLALKITDTEKGTTERYWSNENDLAPLGYKWAFRKSPDKDGKKQKTFRYGLAKETNNGFVYSVDETAVDSVEEAF